METFKQELRNQHLFQNPTILGIAQDNPLTTSTEHCRYDVCLILNDTTTSAKFPLKYGEFPEGKFAVFQLKHTAEAIADWYSQLNILIQQFKLKPRSSPIIERYQDKLMKNGYCEMLLPIE
ncbi:DNA gyrase inhibitor [Streptococcus criceti]|uniref:DNA gyrase inhibitory protein GyrI family protein n=1 Tax=Streptococcus criceti HS-6 TaxID=873449 RepID=G5JT67_STRCG|nr:GyrI-like domain-containing protein [Streptococcus criceti]EHI75130.1 DNA gyrase inhibitory protein GyrI family protein [Streptococcus criceti HS-6]SUN37612.1 DNA gyrase inhibitor [Streptococcus criceti]